MLAWAGVGEGSSTWEVPETGWREGPLLLACFGRGGGEVIGDEPTDTGKDSDSPEEALPQGEGGTGKSDTVGLEVKSVGKPCAGNPHARFDERGWETERWSRLRHRPKAKAAGNSYSLCPHVTAPILDSTGPILLI